MAGKVQGQVQALAKAHDMIRVGALGILSGEAPNVIDQQLRLYVGEGELPDPAPLRKVA